MKSILFIVLFLTCVGFSTQAQDTLRNYTDLLEGKYLGTAVSNSSGENFFTTMWALPNRTYTKKIILNFNAMVAGNEMKFDAIESQQGVFNFADGDKLISFTTDYIMVLRGHCLLWHAQLPGWLGAGSTGYENNNGYTRDSLLSIMKNHIFSVVGHFKGQIKEWDVLNEPFEGNGSLRKSIWQSVIGDDYIDSAFVWAHQADPDAILVLNEYGNETWGSTKADGMFNKIKALVDKGVPIHGAGFQCHVTLGESNFTMISKNFKRYYDIGVKCYITELDIAIPSAKMGTEAAWEQQGRDYVSYVKLMTETDYCQGIMVWGYSDKFSWIPEHSGFTKGEACLFDEMLKPKTAFYAVQDYVKNYLGLGTDIETAQVTTDMVAYVSANQLLFKGVQSNYQPTTARIYNITGQMVKQVNDAGLINGIGIEGLPSGIYIVSLSGHQSETKTRKFIKN